MVSMNNNAIQREGQWQVHFPEAQCTKKNKGAERTSGSSRTHNHIMINLEIQRSVFWLRRQEQQDRKIPEMEDGGGMKAGCVYWRLREGQRTGGAGRARRTLGASALQPLPATHGFHVTRPPPAHGARSPTRHTFWSCTRIASDIPQ